MEKLRPSPGYGVICNIVLIINNSQQQPLLGAVSDPVFSAEFVPCKDTGFMDREDDPLGMILSWLNAALIDPEISAKLKRSLDDISPVSHVFEDNIADPEVWLNTPRFLDIGLGRDTSACFTFNLQPFPFHQVQAFQER